jgi:hypothetical protein
MTGVVPSLNKDPSTFHIYLKNKNSSTSAGSVSGYLGGGRWWLAGCWSFVTDLFDFDLKFLENSGKFQKIPENSGNNFEFPFFWSTIDE